MQKLTVRDIRQIFMIHSKVCNHIRNDQAFDVDDFSEDEIYGMMLAYLNPDKKKPKKSETKKDRKEKHMNAIRQARVDDDGMPDNEVGGRCM
jgi:hypothetical protein